MFSSFKIIMFCVFAFMVSFNANADNIPKIESRALVIYKPSDPIMIPDNLSKDCALEAAETPGEETTCDEDSTWDLRKISVYWGIIIPTYDVSGEETVSFTGSEFKIKNKDTRVTNNLLLNILATIFFIVCLVFVVIINLVTGIKDSTDLKATIQQDLCWIGLCLFGPIVGWLSGNGFIGLLGGLVGVLAFASYFEYRDYKNRYSKIDKSDYAWEVLLSMVVSYAIMLTFGGFASVFLGYAVGSIGWNNSSMNQILAVWIGSLLLSYVVRYFFLKHEVKKTVNT